MRNTRQISPHGQSDFLAIAFATLAVALIMGAYYGVFLFANSYTSPVVAAFISTGFLALILGWSIRRKFKYGQVIPNRYLPDVDIEESDDETTDTQKLLERSRKIDEFEKQNESSTILSDMPSETVPDADEIDIEEESELEDDNSIDNSEALPRELYMKVLKDESYTIADAKQDASNKS